MNDSSLIVTRRRRFGGWVSVVNLGMAAMGAKVKVGRTEPIGRSAVAKKVALGGSWRWHKLCIGMGLRILWWRRRW